MKIVGIGDAHGKSIWKQIVERENADKIVFVGDYFDSHDGTTGVKQIENFEDIITYKKKNHDIVKLLIGNHDFHYINKSKYKYSGYQDIYRFDIKNQLLMNLNLLQLCYASPENNVIFSHAGFTKTWCNSVIGNSNIMDLKLFEHTINTLFKIQPECVEFTPGDEWEETGDEICQTPIWVRPNSLLADKIDNHRQVVGHTCDTMHIKNGIAFIDSLMYNQYLVIENKIMYIKTI